MAQPKWVTPAGSIGIFPILVPMYFQLVATPVLPATTLTFKLLSGVLPDGLTLNLLGLITGSPTRTLNLSTYKIVVRVTDNLGNIADRTFNLGITGSNVPEFTTIGGLLLSVEDSNWVELQINYNNPITNNPINISVEQGQLPPGLEVNETGLIRGYPEPPTILLGLPPVVSSVSETNGTNNYITALSTNGFSVGRPVYFTGIGFGNLETNKIYYVAAIIDEHHFTVSLVIGDNALQLSSATGYMTVTLPEIDTKQPTTKKYNFTLRLVSPLGNDTESYSITIINQNSPPSQSGPGKPINTRVPTILNTRPLSYDIYSSIDNYGYYLFPPDSNGATYPLSQFAYIGQVESDNYFSFKILGKDFDNNTLKYIYNNLPLGLEGDPDTGWITGNPILPDNTVDDFKFSVQVYKINNSSIKSNVFNFYFKLYNDVTGNIVWLSPENLGQIYNGSISDKKIIASSDVILKYRIKSGSLPPNLTLSPNGEITGITAYQPTNILLSENAKTRYTFQVEAYSDTFNIVSSVKTFYLDLLQEFSKPTDTLFIKCTPNIHDREILRSLLKNDSLIPSSYLYREGDINYGKATGVNYVHAYGIDASNLNEYLAAVTKNHYWRNITLGEISTAVARNNAGEVIYEVVYSNVIDNLVNLKTPPQSVSKEIYWPRKIDLQLGPWYTSVTNIYTSFGPLNGQPTFYTSLTPGYARLLYPNSLPNMREQVGDVLGQEFDYKLLPSWMTSQQLNGSTLGYIPAWVICFTKPYIVVDGQNMTYEQFEVTGLDRSLYKSYAEIIKNNIEKNWKNEYGKNLRLNEINFEIDRFTVDKSITYNYDNNFDPPAWTQLPSATPAPNPIDSKDFYVLFPRETILPNKTQY